MLKVKMSLWGIVFVQVRGSHVLLAGLRRPLVFLSVLLLIFSSHFLFKVLLIGLLLKVGLHGSLSHGSLVVLLLLHLLVEHLVELETLLVIHTKCS